jgi:hypothetical protein
MHSYVQLARVPWDKNKSRMASLTKHDDYEVRLVELLQVEAGNIPLLWIELYDRNGRISVDSQGCGDLGAAVLAAERAISQARRLAEEKCGCALVDKGKAE